MDALDRLLRSLMKIYEGAESMRLAMLIRKPTSFNELTLDHGFITRTVERFEIKFANKIKYGESKTIFLRDRPITLNKHGLLPFVNYAKEMDDMGGKEIDKHEMAQLISLVLDKKMSMQKASKKFAFTYSSACRYLRMAENGEFDYARYLQEEPASIESNESDDSSIFAVAEMIDFAVTQALTDQLEDVKKIIEAVGARQKSFEQNVTNKISVLEKTMYRKDRGTH